MVPNQGSTEPQGIREKFAGVRECIGILLFTWFRAKKLNICGRDNLFFALHLISGEKMDICGRDDLFFNFLALHLISGEKVEHLRTWWPFFLLFFYWGRHVPPSLPSSPTYFAHCYSVGLKGSNWACWIKHKKFILVFLRCWSILVSYCFVFWSCSFGLLFFSFYIV